MSLLTRLFRKADVREAERTLRDWQQRLADDVEARKRFVGRPYAKRRHAALKAIRPNATAPHK